MTSKRRIKDNNIYPVSLRYAHLPFLYLYIIILMYNPMFLNFYTLNIHFDVTVSMEEL